MAEMALPVGAGDLVADQPVDGLGIGDAQQRLGEAHQRDALGRGQRIFVQKRVEAALAEALAADRVDEAAGGRSDAIARLGRNLGGGEDNRNSRALVLLLGIANRRAQRRLGRHAAGFRIGKNQVHCEIFPLAPPS